MIKIENKKTLQLKQVVEDAEKKAILTALKITGNNRSEAARLLGISRRALYDKIGSYVLDGPVKTRQQKPASALRKK